MIRAIYYPGKSGSLPEMFLKLPEDECKAPRDGLRHGKTEDMLFLATLLKRAGDTRYFLELRGGAIVPEPLATDELKWEILAPMKSRIRRVTVLRWLRERFFAFRQGVADAIPLPFVIEPEGKELRKPRQWKPEHPWMAGKGLKWPFESGHDPLLSDLHKIPLLSWQEKRPLNRGEVYCPIDGPVIPIKHEWKSPPWTWEHMCGRAWRAFLCPHCLGQFQVELIAMN